LTSLFILFFSYSHMFLLFTFESTYKSFFCIQFSPISPLVLTHIPPTDVAPVSSAQYLTPNYPPLVAQMTPSRMKSQTPRLQPIPTPSSTTKNGDNEHFPQQTRSYSRASYSYNADLRSTISTNIAARNAAPIGMSVSLNSCT